MQLPRQDIRFVEVRAPDVERHLPGFADAYQRIFSGEPYFEAFTREEAENTFRRLTRLSGNITILALDVDDRVLGFGVAIPLKHQPDVARELTGLVPLKHTMYLAELGVLPEFRGLGLGRQLVRERVKRVDQEHYSHVVLRVAEGASSSAMMYRALHFTDMGVSMEVTRRRVDGTTTRDVRHFMARVLSHVPVND